VIANTDLLLPFHDKLYQTLQKADSQKPWEDGVEASISIQKLKSELEQIFQENEDPFPFFTIPQHQAEVVLPFWKYVLEELRIEPIVIYKESEYQAIIQNQAQAIAELTEQNWQQEGKIRLETQYHDHERKNNLTLIERMHEMEHAIREIQTSSSYRLGLWLTAPFRLVYGIFNKRKLIATKLAVMGRLIGDSLKHPGRLMKVLNTRNLATLLKALINEPPEELRDNFLTFFYREEEKQDVNSASDSRHFPKIRILYIPPNLPEHDKSSGGKRAFRMVELLSKTCEVFVFTLGAKPAADQLKLEQAGITVIPSYQLAEAVSMLQQVDVIIYAWHYTYSSAKEFTSAFPHATVIVDSVDVHWVRETRAIGHEGGLSELKVRQNKQREVNTYQAADVVWAVTEEDQAAILTEIPGAKVEVVSNIHSPVLTAFTKAPEKNMLFFGGFQHTPNVTAVQAVAEQILPLVQARIPEAKLLIAGSKAPPEVIELGMKTGVEYLGFIEEEDIPALYQRSLISVSPLPYGAGIKGKICESISFMTPVATNAIGNEGIGLEHEKEALISEDADVLAASIADAMEGKYDLAAMTTAAQKKLEYIVSPATVSAAMQRSIMPQIAICIVTWNQQKLLQECLESIFSLTSYPNFVVMVHSNGCEDGTQKLLQNWAQTENRLKPILSSKNEVFVLPNNRVMEMTPDNDVVLLNNDTQVTEGWLMGLYRAAYSSDTVGIAGSKLLFPDGRLQEFGSELYADGTGRNLGKFEDPAKEAFQQMQTCGYVSGCSMYIKRSTIEKIGTFDEQFHPCYYEDSDFCYTAKEQGLETVVTPWSVIYHLEGATSGTDASEGFKACQEVNRGKFVAKHQGKSNGIIWEPLLAKPS